MAVVNGYCTLEDIQDLLRIDSVDGGDDAVIEDMITRASRLIDGITRRTFYARTETHLYDVPWGRTLCIDDDDLLTITTLTNGDAEVLLVADYYLYPRNSSPKWQIVLKESSVKSWQPDSSSNTEGVISVAGTWGYSATTPKDIEAACLQIARADYMRRNGTNVTEESVITPAGSVITPSGIPKSALETLYRYRRLI